MAKNVELSVMWEMWLNDWHKVNRKNQVNYKHKKSWKKNIITRLCDKL